jgi:uncharacterized RDD family membrane protein YckC
MATGRDGTSGVVTPEAVRLEFAEADVGSRTVAILADFTILGFAAWLLNVSIGFLVGRAGGIGVPSWVASTALLLINFVLIFGYPLLFETLAHGKTPGKLLLGLRVVTVEGGPVRFRHAAIRAAFWLVDFFLTLGLAAVMATLLSRRHQRLGDMVAGTLVLRERTATGPPEAAVFTVPAGAEEYAATIDPAGVTADDYDTVRRFLLRAPALKPDARDRIGGRIAGGLAPKVRHEIPNGVSPTVFLTCLAAQYQQRRAPAAAVPHARPETDAWTGWTDAPASDEPDAQWGDFAPPR